MDFKEFFEEDFNPKDWINKTLSTEDGSDAQGIKELAYSLVMKLEVALQETNKNVENMSNQIVHNLPRVLRDIETLSHEAKYLRAQMNEVKADTEEVERTTAASMEGLVSLDSVKSRMEDTAKALRQADNWTTHLTDVEELMDGGDFEAIGSKLVSLQNCLSVLRHVTDFEDRVATLEGLKVRLEALLSPHLVSAFDHRDKDAFIRFASILGSLGRYKNLEDFYVKCETQSLMSAWQADVEGHIMGGPPSWLSTFYDRLSLLLTKQMHWCEEVFPESKPSLLLGNMTLAVLSNLDPSLSRVVGIAIRQQDDPLAFLEAVKEVTEMFVSDFEKTILVSDADLSTLKQKIVLTSYEPLRNQMKQYQEFEEAVLLSHAVAADISSEDLFENLTLLKEYCQRILGQVEASVARCLKVSDGSAFLSLVAAVQTYLLAVLERVSVLTSRVGNILPSVIEDWDVFATSLSLIQVSGGLLIAVDEVEQCLSAALTKISKTSLKLAPEILLDDKEALKFAALLEKAESDEGYRLLGSVHDQSKSQCEKSVAAALTSILDPITKQLTAVPRLPSWNAPGTNSSTLSAAFSPQEYVTQIGQYLMTLPQHLEPLLLDQNPSLTRALQDNLHTTASGRHRASESESNPVAALIGRVGQDTCRLFCDAFIRIPEVAPHMITQLVTDVDYICNIMEDLGVSSCDPLNHLKVLLNAPAEEYWQVAPGNPPRLVAAVRQIRNIAAKS